MISARGGYALAKKGAVRLFAFLKSSVPVFLAACVLCSCAASMKGPLPMVLVTDGKPFPDIPHDYQAGGYALKCAHGYYAEKHIDQCDLKRTHGHDARPDPQGRGKVHTRYAMWWNGYRTTPEYWGYTFTIHTRNNGIITNCSVTQQLLEKK
jgi:hypothetical protein